MTVSGYADGLLKPANQVRAQKALVKKVPGSNMPQPAKGKRVKQSMSEMLEAIWSSRSTSAETLSRTSCKVCNAIILRV